MPSMEQVERLRSYADISVEEARDVLEEAGGDLLEAVILLEKRGKLKKESGSYRDGAASGSTGESKAGPHAEQSSARRDDAGVKFSELAGRFFRWLGRVIHRGNQNSFRVSRRGETMITVPITVLALLLMFCFWCVIPLLVIGLFCDCRYSFHGPDLGRDNVNSVADSVADSAARIKREVKDAARSHERDDSDH